MAQDDDDIRVGADDEDEPRPTAPGAPRGGMVDDTLPPSTRKDLEQKYGAKGRIIAVERVPLSKEEQEAPSDVLDERKRFKVTFENGERRKYVVVVRTARPNTQDFDSVESEGEIAPPNSAQSQGTIVERNGETWIIKDGKATRVEGIPADTPKGTLVEREDGTYLVSADGKTATKVEGLPPKTPPKPKPSEAKNWQPLTTPDGRVVALVDPATGDTVAVSQKDPAKPNVFETKDGRIITVDPDGKTATDITPDKPGDRLIPENAPRYVPDYDQDDGGLTDYNNRLLEAARAGIINKDQAIRLLQQAGAIWEATATHGGKRRDQALTARNQDITQRGQTLDEAASRRTTAAQGADAALSQFGEYAGVMPVGSGGIAANAVRAALDLRRNEIERQGGFQEVPEVPSYMKGGELSIKQGSDGSVSIKMPMASKPSAASTDAVAGGVTATTKAAADPSKENVDAANSAVQTGSNAAFGAVGVGPGAAPNSEHAQPSDPGMPGGPPPVQFSDGKGGFGVPGQLTSGGGYVQQVPSYLESARSSTPAWDRERMAQQLRDEGFPDDVIEEALASA